MYTYPRNLGASYCTEQRAIDHCADELRKADVRHDSARTQPPTTTLREPSIFCSSLPPPPPPPAHFWLAWVSQLRSTLRVVMLPSPLPLSSGCHTSSFHDSRPGRLESLESVLVPWNRREREKNEWPLGPQTAAGEQTRGSSHYWRWSICGWRGTTKRKPERSPHTAYRISNSLL